MTSVVIGCVIGLCIGYIAGWCHCAWNATQPCPDCNEVIPCGQEKKDEG